MNSINSLLSIPSTHSAPVLFPPISPSADRRRRRRPPAFTVTASSRPKEQADSNSYYADGKLVDESMIVLRKRIHEIKTAEQTHDPPRDWFDWEKRCYSNYDSNICEALGYLQSHLMNTRPSVALGMLALLTLSVPVSSAVLLHRFIEIAVGLLAGIRLC
ncbi:uncharacterized protein LOC111810800 [Cucurbita pepo subsp. pepo]|uniref:uncharacterized protein LOC111810800 n=1 Tax=Cucurbita pepo subsp. pepo TaxID=3664 RepID=UPI000C9D8B5E|nr:uncharacterized protein LOC111810800 [Cucurbita pepo subsp. pepo]